MSTIKAKVTQQQVPATPVVVSTLGAERVAKQVGIQGIAGNAEERTLESANNVDTTTLETGSILIYNLPATKWIASRNLVAQDMDGGNF
jgi:hypothetical protein